jgi:hypothetical protein
MKYKKEVFRAKFLKLFVDYKILTLDVLKKKLGCSAFHIQSMLNNVGYHVSFTDNNKWYTLSNIPEFNEKGFWFFNEIGFSKHGNMGQTILYFINKSENGLTAKEIKEIISKKCLSILNIMFKKDQLERISGNNGYIYFLKKTQKQKIEKTQLLEAKKASMPSDIDAIHILVALIQNPNSSPSDLSLVLKDKISCNLDSITTLFQHFCLEKKTEDR